MKTFRAGQPVTHGDYQAFMPMSINRRWTLVDPQIQSLLSKADQQIGRLDMYSSYVDIDLYLSLHIAKEAIQSSKIEGTQTSMSEVFMDKNDLAAEKRDDWEEVQNYIAAMKQAIKQLNQLPFSSRLIRDAHRILLQGVRGQHKMPGEFRTSQNWIGGSSISNATFIPPPAAEIGNLMSDLEKFANDADNPLPVLLKIAIIHYQFETIHPFLDGNGRVGRLLITLFLVNAGILHQPILYLSDFFERNRSAYYDKLTRVRAKHDLNQWLAFFLTGVIETAEKGVNTFDGILQITRSLDQRLRVLKGRAPAARTLIDQLYRKPIVNASQVAQIIGKSDVSAYRLISSLEELGILREITGNGRNRLYAFQEYLDLFAD